MPWFAGLEKALVHGSSGPRLGGEDQTQGEENADRRGRAHWPEGPFVGTCIVNCMMTM